MIPLDEFLKARAALKEHISTLLSSKILASLEAITQKKIKYFEEKGISFDHDKTFDVQKVDLDVVTSIEANHPTINNTTSFALRATMQPIHTPLSFFKGSPNWDKLSDNQKTYTEHPGVTSTSIDWFDFFTCSNHANFTSCFRSDPNEIDQRVNALLKVKQLMIVKTYNTEKTANFIYKRFPPGEKAPVEKTDFFFLSGRRWLIVDPDSKKLTYDGEFGQSRAHAIAGALPFIQADYQFEDQCVERQPPESSDYFYLWLSHSKGACYICNNAGGKKPYKLELFTSEAA